MPLYTFYPCRLDDTSLTFESHDLADDAEAWTCAMRVLQEHPSAAFIVAWCGDRRVLTRDRVDQGPPRRPLRPAGGKPARSLASLRPPLSS